MILFLYLLVNVQDIVPSLCVTASISPSTGLLFTGGSATISCLAESDLGILSTNVTVVQYKMDGSMPIVHVPSFDSNLTLLQSHRYNLFLDNLTEEDDGNYSCVARIDTFNILVQENITVSVQENLIISTTNIPGTCIQYN